MSFMSEGNGCGQFCACRAGERSFITVGHVQGVLCLWGRGKELYAYMAGAGSFVPVGHM